MPDSNSVIRTMRGIQQSFPLPIPVPRHAPLEPKGVVYTKRWVVDLLLDLAGYKSTANLVDAVAIEPSAGDGAFLGPMAERLAESCERLGRPISDCSHSILAYELDEVSAARARDVAFAALTSRGIPAPTASGLARSWVRSGDYLLDSMTVKADFAIGNPPYVRLEEIPEETASFYRSAYLTMRGRADLYVAFFEAALSQLKEDGVCAFICADRWMRNQYGSELRELIASSFAIEVIVEMHHADAFDDEVDAYPAITVIRRRTQEAVVVASAGPDVQNASAGLLANALRAIFEREETAMPAGLRAARVDTWFKAGDPWPCQSPDQLALLRRLEEQFAPLETNAKVGIGVATGNDKVFVTKDAHLVEPSRLLKLAMAKDIRNGKLCWSGHYLVDPWNCDGLISLEQYPRLRAYYEAHATSLKQRHTAFKSGHAWYKTIDRVTHALTGKPKLYIADIKNSLEPVLDPGETYPHHNLYFIQSEDWDLEVLGGLLMSAIGQFFVESYGVRMRGGYLRFQAQYLRRIRVPAPNLLSEAQSHALRLAFRAREKRAATKVALQVYRIGTEELENALGHR